MLLLKGAPVAAQISQESAALCEELKAEGIIPTLAILRVGERPDDLSYERSAIKKCEAAGVQIKSIVLPADVDNTDYLNTIKKLNEDDSVHGVLMFLPLPAHLDEKAARALLSPSKDIDGITQGSQAGVYNGSGLGYPPCTAAAVMKILEFYEIDPAGKNTVVLGRSLVIGKPVSMMLLEKNATVTICHSKTADVAATASKAEILIACTGRMESIGPEYTNPDQVIVDVGISWNEQKGKLCGDVDFDAVADNVGAISPVPGGVGGVTSAILVSHVVQAAKRA